MDATTTSLPTHTNEYQSQRDRFAEPTRRALSFRPNGAWWKNLIFNLRDFFIATWLDWLTFVIIGATAAGVSRALPIYLIPLQN